MKTARDIRRQTALSPAAGYMVALRILDEDSGLSQKEEIQNYYAANERLLDAFYRGVSSLYSSIRFLIFCICLSTAVMVQRSHIIPG